MADWLQSLQQADPKRLAGALRAPVENQAFVVHSSGQTNENTGNVGKPKIHGVALTKPGARAIADKITRANWEEHGAVGDNYIGDYPEHMAAIAAKHGIDPKSIEHSSGQDDADADDEWGHVVHDPIVNQPDPEDNDPDNFSWKRHPALHRDITAFENGPTPYPGMTAAHEHFRDSEQEHLIPYVSPTTIG
jgi:hypothetical protein